MVDGELPSERADYESTPLTRGEYIAAVVHLYRGEQYRANTWRLRLDHTTNWAVLTTAGLLSFTFSGREGGHSHWILLLGTALITMLLAFEARRFRLWHVWRSRVRLIEENFYGPILRRDPVSPASEWANWVAADLFQPSFKITRLAAIRARLTRNYWAIYLVLFFAWALKVVLEPTPAHSWAELRDNLGGADGAGYLPWWGPLIYVGGVLAAILTLLLVTPRTPSSEEELWREHESGDTEHIDIDF